MPIGRAHARPQETHSSEASPPRVEQLPRTTKALEPDLRSAVSSDQDLISTTWITPCPSAAGGPERRVAPWRAEPSAARASYKTVRSSFTLPQRWQSASAASACSTAQLSARTYGTPLCPGASVTDAWAGEVGVLLELLIAASSGDPAFFCRIAVLVSGTLEEHNRRTEGHGPRWRPPCSPNEGSTALQGSLSTRKPMPEPPARPLKASDLGNITTKFR